MSHRLRIMLDSGAYSAWKKGETLSIKDYIAYIKEHAELFHSYVSLDTIPGSAARMEMAQAAIEKSAVASYRNHQIMKDAGLHPIPVFHQGERLTHLERYVDDGEPYIGISPYHRGSRKSVYHWLDQCFALLTDGKGRPITRTHGFGVTWYAYLLRYPWSTVDSVTWSIAPVYGRLTIPKMHPGEFDPLNPAVQFGVTGLARLSSRKQKKDSTGWNIDLLGDEGRAWVGKYAEMCGVTLAALRNDEHARVLAQVKYFRFIEKRLKGGVLFTERKASFGKVASRKAIAGNTFRVVFSTSIGRSTGNWALDQCGVSDRLLSYYILRGLSDGRLEAYINGTDGSGKRRNRPRAVWSSGTYRDLRAQLLTAREVMEDGCDSEIGLDSSFDKTGAPF